MNSMYLLEYTTYIRLLRCTMGSSPATHDFTFFVPILEFQIKQNGLKRTLDQFVATTEEPGIHKPVNGSPSSIGKFQFPSFWEYFQ